MSAFRLPPEALTQHIAILGKTGSGKTYAAKSQVEPLLEDDRQVVIIDPTGAWWGLRSSADGKGPGFRILVLGGEHGDMPLPAMGGAAVARLVTEQRVSAVLDTSHMTVGERTRWFTEFAGTLYRTIKSPLHLVIDEAHNFMPQGRIPDPDAGKMLHAGNQIMSGGRSRGIRGWLITQRPAKLHKDSLTCADTLIAMRVIAPQDRDAIKAWIDGAGDAQDGRQVLDTLASLERGEGWVWFPEGKLLKRVRFPRIKTFDSSATPTDGKMIDAPKRAAEIDLTEIRKSLDQAAKEAEANDPKLLRQKVAELTKQLAAKAPATQDAAAAQRQVDRAVRERDAYWAREIEVMKRRQTSLGKLPGLLRDVAATIEGVAAKMNNTEAPRPPAVVNVPMYGTSVHAPAPRSPSSNGHAPHSDLPKPYRKILESASFWRTCGVETPTVPQLAAAAGYAASGSFDTYLSRMGTEGLLVRQDGRVTLTEAGWSKAPEPDQPPDLVTLHARIMTILDGPGQRIMSALIDRGGGPLSVADLAAASNYAASGSFDTYLSRLGTKGLLIRKNGQVQATEVVFPVALT